MCPRTICDTVVHLADGPVWLAAGVDVPGEYAGLIGEHVLDGPFEADPEPVVADAAAGVDVPDTDTEAEPEAEAEEAPTDEDEPEAKPKRGPGRPRKN